MQTSPRLCKECKLGTHAYPFCPVSGAPHDVPTECPKCGLRNVPFCAATGERHGFHAPAPEAARTSKWSGAGVAAEALAPAERNELRRRAHEEAFAHAFKEAMGQTRKPLVDISEEARLRLMEDGYGIFAPGNPVFERKSQSGEMELRNRKKPYQEATAPATSQDLLLQTELQMATSPSSWSPKNGSKLDLDNIPKEILKAMRQPGNSRSSQFGIAFVVSFFLFALLFIAFQLIRHIDGTAKQSMFDGTVHEVP